MRLDAIALAQRAYDNMEPPQNREVSGEVTLELDGLTFECNVVSLDDDLEVFMVATENETLCFGGISNTRKNQAQCEAVLKLSHRGDDLLARLKVRAVAKLLTNQEAQRAGH